MSGFSELGIEAMSPHTVLPPMGDIMEDVGSSITIASLVNNEYNFTEPEVHEASVTKVLGMPLYLFIVTVILATITICWVVRKFLKPVYRRVELPSTSEYENGNQTPMERIPTEVSSARLLHAVKIEVDMAEVTEYGRHRERISEFTTVEL